MADQIVEPRLWVGTNYSDQFRHESSEFYIPLPGIY